MAFNGSGTFNLVSGNPVVTGTVISSTVHNNTMSDIASNGLSNCITKDGQTTITDAIPFNNQRITGLGAATSQNDAATSTQVQNASLQTLSSVSGADTITATANPTITGYTTGQIFYFEPASNNTGAATLNVDSVGAVAIQNAGSALVADQLVSGQAVAVRYDGTQFQLLSKEGVLAVSDIASQAQAEAGSNNTTLMTPLRTEQAIEANAVDQDSDTGAANLPTGTEAQRPGTPAAGMFRFNSDDNVFEGYNGTDWGSVGGATGGGGNPFIYENDTNVTVDYTITSGKNAMSAGPITVDSGVTVTVPSGSVWTIV